MTSFVNKQKPGMGKFTAELNGQFINFYAFTPTEAGQFAMRYFKPNMRNRPNLSVKPYVEPTKAEA